MAQYNMYGRNAKQQGIVRVPKLNKGDFCELVGISRMSLDERIAKSDTVPEFIFVSGNRKCWDKAEILNWHETFNNSKIAGRLNP